MIEKKKILKLTLDDLHRKNTEETEKHTTNKMGREMRECLEVRTTVKIQINTPESVV